MKKKIALILTAVLLASGFSESAASADALSDARLQLTALQTQLSTANQTFATQSAAVTSLTAQLANVDTTTVTAVQISALQSQLATATQAKLAAQQQISTLPAAIDVQIIQIRMLEIQAAQGQNCPTTWGVTPVDFNQGLSDGNFKFSAKVFDKVSAEPRNIVVNAQIQLSQDSVNWNTRQQFSYNNYAGNSWFKNTNFGIQPSAMELVNLGETRIRVTTVMAKDGCETLTISTDGILLPNSVTPNDKQTIDVLYATYLPGIANFQQRDALKAVYGRIKTDLPNAFNQGQMYTLNDGYQGTSQLFVAARTKATCGGKINNIIPVQGQVCEVGVYWTTGSIWKLVDIISVTGGVNAAQVEAAKLRAELAPLQAGAKNYISSFSNLSNRVNNLSSDLDKYRNGNIQVDQGFFAEAEKIRSEISSLVSVQNVAVNRASAILNLPGIDDEIRYGAQMVIDYYQNKMGPISSISNRLTQILSQASSINPENNAEVNAWIQKTQAIGSSLASQLKQADAFSAEFQKIFSNGFSAKNSAYVAKYQAINNSELQKLIDIQNSIQDSGAYAAKMASVPGSTGAAWQKVAAMQSSNVNLLLKAIKIRSSIAAQLKAQGALSDNVVTEDDGSEEDPSGSIEASRDNSGRYVIQVTTNQEESDVVIRATRAGQKTIVFRQTTDTNGEIRFRTSRRLAGWTVTLYFEDQVLDRFKGIK